MTNTASRASLVALAGAVLLGGCVYREKVVAAPPAASPPTTVTVAGPAERVVTYPEGRWELRGEGTAASPYYWVWIPEGAAPPALPPVPKTPPGR
ncbi:MAG TPA: hypothetical protein VNN07_11675 [Candidatus Tectomicrobia bacterium]|nr:hypothetical protein [Candidatus Tectomicrobia bacterium]